MVVRARDIHFWKRTQKLNCSHNETPSSSTSEEGDLDQGPPQEAVLKAISGSLLEQTCFDFLFSLWELFVGIHYSLYLV